jgi:DNA invertase Pin-like site-specific DNA recombinase
MLVGLARVSTRDQSLTLQTDALERAGCQRVFVEEVSGVAVDRPQRQEALKFIRAGDALVVWRLDRLARSMKQLLLTVEQLHEAGVGFRSLTESIDTTTPGGMLVFHIFGAVAEFERNLIRDRSLAGLEAAKARGRVGGRPKKMTVEDVRLAKAMLGQPGVRALEVAKRMGVSKATLYRQVGD